MSSYNDYQHWPQESTSNIDDEVSSPEIEPNKSDDDTESSTTSTSTSATSSSGSSQSGSDSESTSTADEDETISLKTEIALANKTELVLPADICEDEGVFKQLFSVNSWVCLSDQQKQHLKNFLPTFPENDLMEKEITLRMLFGGQNFRFGVNPINDFHEKLRNGHFRPDIVKMKSLLRRSLKREYRKKQRIYSYNMFKKILSGRKKIIDDLNGFASTSMKNCDSHRFTLHQQVKRRYFRELSGIKHLIGDNSDDSSDSNYQEGPPPRLSKKQRRHLCAVQNSLSPDLETVTSTLANYPNAIDLSKVALPMSNPFDPTEDMYREMLINHKRKQKNSEQEQEQIRFDFINEYIRPTVSLGVEKKRSAFNDRPRVKRTKSIKQQTQSLPPVQLDIKPPISLDEFDNTSIKQEQFESELSNIVYVKEEVFSSPSPSSTPPVSPSIRIASPKLEMPDFIEEESIKTNLNAIQLNSCLPIAAGLIKMETNILDDITIKMEPISLTADEIRKAEEGQVAAMLLEQMSNVEQKYNVPLTPSPPLPPPLPSPPPVLPLENIPDSKFSPPMYLIKREFHPEDMLTSTVQSINTESPPRMLQSCLHSLTSSDYSSKHLSLSPITTPSKVITDSNYGGSLSELEGFHVLDIKVESTEELNEKRQPKSKKIVSFFVLIRDIICSTWEYRMDMSTLLDCVLKWAKSTSKNYSKNPNWYHCLALKTWPKALQSAIGFLAGHFPEWQPEDFVPFIEYKPSLDTYQWIGASRDSDTRLGDLCKCWLHNLNSTSSKFNVIKDEKLSINMSPVPSTTDIISTIEVSETDSSISLPTPLLDTWIVTSSNAKERAIFQSQEKQRFLKPHRSFIYRMHGYESIVGPVRGIYNSSNIHKAARGHSLLIENRPHFISILVLVRDATARLPNGMGTRSDICTLLKDSQYLMEANQTELHNAVSGALDRLHYEYDPCVKYDPKRKIWIYLHRGRSLEEFERLHLEQQGAVKIKSWRRNKTPKKLSETKRLLNRKLNRTSNALLESLSMLDLPTSSTSDSILSSSALPVLSDMNMRLAEDITNIDNLKRTVKPPRGSKNKKNPIQTKQTTDNAVELKIKCSTVMDQNSTETSQMFTMPVSNNISTVTFNNSSIISTSNMISQPMTSNITTSQPMTRNITTGQPMACNMTTSRPMAINITTSQPTASNIISQPMASNIISQPMASNIISQSIASNITNQPITSNITCQSIASSFGCQPITSNITCQSIASSFGSQPITSNITCQSIASSFGSQPITSNITSQSIASSFGSQRISSNIGQSIARDIISQSIASNINQSMASNISQPIASNITSQPITSNITSQSIASSFGSQPITSNITSQSIASSFGSQPITSNITSQSIANSFGSQLISSNIGQSIANNITRQSFANNIINKSIVNTSLKVNAQTVPNSGQMINITQTKNSTNQSLIGNNKMIVNNITSNVCNFNDKQLLSSGDLITIGARKKTNHVQIAQPVTIGQSSGPLNFQQDHLSTTKLPCNKEPLQRQILVLKQKLSDHSISSSEQNTTVVSQNEPQTVQHLLQMQQRNKFQKQKQQEIQLKFLQRKQLQQQALQKTKQTVIIRKSDVDNKMETGDGEHPQVIFVKQGPKGIQTEAQQITQQQLQQILMLRQQQQTGQQPQVVMVKQPGNEQKPIAFKPILTSLRGTQLQPNSQNSTNLLLQAKQTGQNIQRRITKPVVGKLMPNQRTQLPVDTIFTNRKLPGISHGTSLRISGVQTSKSGQPQYTVVTVAQPKLMPSNQLNIGQQTPTRLSALKDRLKSGDTNQSQTLRVVQSQIGGKPVLVTSKAQMSSALTGLSTSPNIVSSTVMNSTANTYTVLQQGSQQILVPANSLKSIQGLKVIPLSQHSVKGRSQMYARIVKPDNVRPVFFHQPSNQDTNQGPSESNT